MAARIGKKRAAVAVGHTILTIVYHLLNKRQLYVELGADYLHFEPTETSVSDYMDYWFKNYVMLNCKYNTQNGYENIIRNHIKPSFGIYKLK